MARRVFSRRDQVGHRQIIAAADDLTPIDRTDVEAVQPVAHRFFERALIRQNAR